MTSLQAAMSRVYHTLCWSYCLERFYLGKLYLDWNSIDQSDNNYSRSSLTRFFHHPFKPIYSYQWCHRFLYMNEWINKWKSMVMPMIISYFTIMRYFSLQIGFYCGFLDIIMRKITEEDIKSVTTAKISEKWVWIPTYWFYGLTGLRFFAIVEWRFIPKAC